RSERRLFMQLLVFGDCPATEPLVEVLEAAKIQGALYLDLHNPHGVALLAMNEDPTFFTGPLRTMLRADPWRDLRIRPEYTMFGRTYTLGYEPDIEHTLLTRPRQTATNPDWPWVVWYPLRRNGAFSQLPEEQQRAILK